MCAPIAKPSRRSFGGALGFEAFRKEMLEFSSTLNSPNESVNDFEDENVFKAPFEIISSNHNLEGDANSNNEHQVDMDRKNGQERQCSDSEDSTIYMETQSKSKLEIENDKLRAEIVLLRQELECKGHDIFSKGNKIIKSRLSDDGVNKRRRKHHGGKSVRFFDSPSQEMIPEEPEMNSSIIFPEEETMDESWLTSSLKMASQQSNDSKCVDDNGRINDKEETHNLPKDMQLGELERVLSSMQVDCFDIKARASVLQEQLLKKNCAASTSFDLSIRQDIEKEDDDKNGDDSLIPKPKDEMNTVEKSAVVDMQEQLDLLKTTLIEKDQLIFQLQSEMELISSVHKNPVEKKEIDSDIEQNQGYEDSKAQESVDFNEIEPNSSDSKLAKEENAEEILQLQHELKMVKSEMNTILSTNQTYNNFEAENENLRKQINHYKGIEEKNKLLAFELDEKEIIIDSYTTESEEMAKKNENLQSEVEEKSKHIDALSEKLNDVSSTNQKNENESKQLKLQEMYDDLLEEHNSLKASLQQSSQVNASEKDTESKMEDCSEKQEVEGQTEAVHSDEGKKPLEESNAEDNSIDTNKELEFFFLEMGKKDSTLKSYEAEIEKLNNMIMELERERHAKDVEMMTSNDETV